MTVGRTGSAVVALAAITSLIVGACSGTQSSAAAPPSPAPVATSSVSATATAAPAVSLVVGGGRPVTVHVPPSYDGSHPAPLLILLHGYSADGQMVDEYFGLADAADKAGFVYATPDGTKDSQGNRFWNATDACCNFDGRNVDDSAYLSGVISEIQGKLAIDPKRIAVVGHSNGGFMSYRMACEHADLLAAIVSLAGETYADPKACTPSAPVSVAQVQGTADDVIEFQGGGPVTTGAGAYPGATTTASTWATYDGCGTEPSTLKTKIDVDGDLKDGSDAAETSVQEWSGCQGGSTVQLWTIPGGGHVPALTPAFAAAVVSFLADHPKP